MMGLRPKTMPRIAALFVASCVLGLVYNSASPLGVRWAASSSAVGGKSLSSHGGAGWYGNETAALSWDTAESASTYRNETVAMSLSPPLSPARPNPSLRPAPHKALPVISWPELKPLLQTSRIVLVDARGSSFYQADHIPGAVSLPATAAPFEFAAFEAKYPKNTALVVYCGTAQCSMAQSLAALLVEQHGFLNVTVMPGGYSEYRLAEALAPEGGAAK